MAERTYHDDILGTLTWNSELEWWEGRVSLPLGHSVGISLSVEEEDAEVEPVLEAEQAHRVVRWLQEDEPEARQLAADELLSIYNEEWNDDEPLSEEEFIARLTLDDVNIAPDGSAELFYKDTGLFAGHTVLVTLDAAGNLEDADIAG